MLLRPLPVLEPWRSPSLTCELDPASRPATRYVSNVRLGSCDVIFSYPMFRDLEQARRAVRGPGGAPRRSARTSRSAKVKSLISLKRFSSQGSYFPVLGIQPALGHVLARTGGGAVRWRGERRRRAQLRLLERRARRPLASARQNAASSTGSRSGPSSRCGAAGIPRHHDRHAGAGVCARSRSARLAAPRFDAGSREPHLYYWIYLFARLKPGVSIEEAYAAIEVPLITRSSTKSRRGRSSNEEGQVEAFRARTLVLEPGAPRQRSVRSGTRARRSRAGRQPPRSLLLIACVNVATSCSRAVRAAPARSRSERPLARRPRALHGLLDDRGAAARARGRARERTAIEGSPRRAASPRSCRPFFSPQRLSRSISAWTRSRSTGGHRGARARVGRGVRAIAHTQARDARCRDRCSRRKAAR